ncbi:MAG: hypothetical protein H9W80_12775 [Enterococcus sp.]|nr:hypothetical protein [Enterococcus sp.]
MARSEAQKKVDEHSKVPKPKSNGRYFWAVLWTENLVDGWEDMLDDLLQLPYCYCVHDKDKDKEGQPRKKHIHMIIAFPNSTTYKHALDVFKSLGENAVNSCETIFNVRYAYDYLIHNTKSAQKANKFQYSKEERICGNNFDIGTYEQIGVAEKLKLTREIADLIVDNGFGNIADLYYYISQNYDDIYLEIFCSKNAMFERLCRGIYLKINSKNKSVTESSTSPAPRQHLAEKCPFCGSDNIKKNGKNASGTQKMRCHECGKIYTN